MEQDCEWNRRGDLPSLTNCREPLLRDGGTFSFEPAIRETNHGDESESVAHANQHSPEHCKFKAGS
jgi:hypothetical protein